MRWVNSSKSVLRFYLLLCKYTLIFPQDWIVHEEHQISMGNKVRGGNFSTLPLFTYGKRRRMICNEIMPETCKYLKSNFNRATSFKVNLVTFCPELILRLFFKMEKFRIYFYAFIAWHHQTNGCGFQHKNFTTGGND